MEALKKFIENTLDIPEINEDEAVYDGSFMIVPYMVSGLKGNGVPQTAVISASLELFYKDKTELVEKAIEMWKALAENKYVVSDPDYVYENNADLWRGTIDVNIIK